MSQPTRAMLRFFAPLDRFVEIRCLSEQTVARLLRHHPPRDKQSYLQFVLEHCVVGYLHRVRMQVRRRFEPDFCPDVLVNLYRLCIEVNPGLDIHQVAIPLEKKAAARQTRRGAEARAQRSPLAAGRLKQLKQRLSRKLIGQEQAVARIARAMQKAALGLQRADRPLGCFLLAGSTGVGKTQLAKELAAGVFGKADRLVRVDCSELAMPHDYARLLGSPPGYVGYGEGGALTEALKDRPASVVLFDEIEKADAKVHQILLQAMDEGILTDGRGETVSLRDAVIVLTSNVGVREAQASDQRAGFVAAGDDDRMARRETAVHRALEATFAPEWLNRLDDIIIFRDLTADDAVQIARLRLQELRTRLAQQDVRLRVSRSVAPRLAADAFDPRYGARSVARAVQQQVEDAIAEYMIEAGAGPGVVLKLAVSEEGIAVRPL